jgi:hypothetical protein
MITKLIAASTLVLSMSAVAAPEWITVADSGEGAVLMNVASIAATGELLSIQVMRNYEQLITLGNDPTTNEMLYPHRSVKLGYLANCESGKLSLASWQMFSGNFGNGETVWTDKENGAPAFMAPSSLEESSALNAACSSRVSAAGTNAIKG